MNYRSEVRSALSRVNNLLKEKNVYANLSIVGGAALIMNNITSIETLDIDTAQTLSHEVKEIFEACSIDINDDAREYINNYEGLEFTTPDWCQFSNLHVEYLTIGGVVVTKMKDTNPEKLSNLAFVLTEDLGLELTQESISNWFEEQGVPYDPDDIDNFLQEVEGFY